MEKTKTKIRAVSLLLGVMAITSTIVFAVSPAQADISTEADLELLHKDLMQVEIQLSEGKLQEETLIKELQKTQEKNEILRKQRQDLQRQANDIINQPLEGLN